MKAVRSLWMKRGPTSVSALALSTLPQQFYHCVVRHCATARAEATTSNNNNNNHNHKQPHTPSTNTTNEEAEEQDELDKENDWVLYQSDKYGEGNYQFFRSLYKELCDNIRREYYCKPPPPFTTEAGVWLPADKDAPPDNGDWTARYAMESNRMVFRREAMPRAGLGRVVAYADVVLQNPDRLNALLTFADWFPIEVLIERKGVVLHFSIAANEGGMHMRNVRAYDVAAMEEGSSGETPVDWETFLLNGDTLEATTVRHEHLYDGPCLFHLELDVQNELYDIMQDHGVHLDWVRWAAEWVFYAENVRYTRWCLDLLEELIPTAVQGPEEDYLLPAEREALDEPVEDWLPPHAA